MENDGQGLKIGLLGPGTLPTDNEEIQGAKKQSVKALKDNTAAQVMEFFLDPKTFGPILGLLKGGEEDLDQTVGKLTAQITERVAMSAAEQDMELPQAVLWGEDGAAHTALKAMRDMLMAEGKLQESDKDEFSLAAYTSALAFGQAGKISGVGAKRMSDMLASSDGEAQSSPETDKALLQTLTQSEGAV